VEESCVHPRANCPTVIPLPQRCCGYTHRLVDGRVQVFPDFLCYLRDVIESLDEGTIYEDVLAKGLCQFFHMHRVAVGPMKLISGDSCP